MLSSKSPPKNAFCPFRYVFVVVMMHLRTKCFMVMLLTANNNNSQVEYKEYKEYKHDILTDNKLAEF